MKLLPLKDKNGKELPDDCIIHGSLKGEEEKHYFRIGFNEEKYISERGLVEMIASTYGYIHNVQQEDIANFELIGLAKDNLHLLECD
jgi:hypothetical protein